MLVTDLRVQQLRRARLTFTHDTRVRLGPVPSELALRAEIWTPTGVSSSEYHFMDPDWMGKTFDAAVEETLRRAFHLAVIEPLGEQLKADITEAIANGVLKL